MSNLYWMKSWGQGKTKIGMRMPTRSKREETVLIRVTGAKGELGPAEQRDWDLNRVMMSNWNMQD